MLRSLESAMRFTWDPDKAKANREKHGVSFEEAVSAFGDPFAIYDPDKDFIDRGILIGASSSNRVLFVVHIVVVSAAVTDDAKEIAETAEEVRIISARKASKAERKRYERPGKEA